MAEAIATGLALDAAKTLTMLVTARVVEELKLACWGFNDQFEILRNRFAGIQAFLEDLGIAKYAEKSKFVNLWLKRLTDVAYSADELIDDYEYELLRRKIELKINHPSFKKKCNNFFSPATNPVVFRIRMICRVREILSKLNELDNEAIKNGLQKVSLAREAASSSSAVGYYDDNEALHEIRKHAMARGSEFIGRESDLETLLQMIPNPTCHQVDRLPVVAIVGIGGLGKTTIARRLFENENLDFDKKIWICVSDDFKVNKILNEMVEYLTSVKSDLTSTGAITNKLSRELKRKKLFLVLDDVWEDNQDLWDSFKNQLLSIGDLRGCVLLITTRNINVAEKARALYQHKLEGLSEDEGWALLHQRVYNKPPPHNSHFEDVGRRIVNNKCKGVPLAIKAIGGILQSKKHSYVGWESIENSELWGFRPQDINDIMPSLLLSYNHLDDVYLKQCFAYCAIFSKDSEMEKHQLITMWMAQGFLHDESVGEEYFNVLLNYSFLEGQIDVIGGPRRYKMHDLVHDLAAYVLNNDLLVWKLGIKLHDEVSHVRHLVLDLSNNQNPPETFTRGLSVRKLRTISFWNDLWINTTLGCAQNMRTLIMASTGLKEVPSIIGQLVHLRYLDLSYNSFDVLPESICNLYQLQTLRILDCFSLRELPRELYRLENLRHLEASNYDYLWASRRLGQLTNLQSLPPLELRDGEGWTIDELGPLRQLDGEMKIRGLHHVKNRELAIQASFGKKNKIATLHLEWGDENREEASQVNDEDVLDSLEPHSNLKLLHLQGFMGVRFPSWMMKMAVKHGGHSTPLINLTELTLICCRRCLQLPTLGKLPFLQSLWMQNFDDLECIGDEFYQSNNDNNYNASELVSLTAEGGVFFPSLRDLAIWSFKRLATWNPPSSKHGAVLFPNLERLWIQSCPQLKEVPCLQLNSLKDLHLVNIGGSQPLDIIKYSHALTKLYVEAMEKLMMLPQELSNCTNLETLDIKNCVNMKSIPNGLISLKILDIEKCPSLACIPDGLSSLHDMRVNDCKGLERMPKSLEESTSLEELMIKNCPLIKGPIPNLGRLHGLKQLRLVNSGELITCLHWLPNFHHHLWKLEISGDSREEWDFNLKLLQSLTELTLRDFKNVKTLPQQFLPFTLQILEIERFNELEQVPEWIGNLSSLQRLIISYCKRLKYLPSKQAMSSLSKLQYLYIIGCPLLKERCAKEDGPEWHKISHIHLPIYISDD